MGKPVAGEVVVVPFPQTDLSLGKRRPAFVAASLPGDDVVLCQITSQPRGDAFEVSVYASDFQRGQLHQDSFRANRLFTIDSKIILYSVGFVKSEKLAAVRAKIRNIFV